MAKGKKASGKAGGSRGGNVVVDLGEEIDQMMGKAFKAGYTPKNALGAAGGAGGSFGLKPGIHRSQLGMALDMPAAIDPMKAFGGVLAGTAAQRVLYRLVPYLTKLDRELVVNLINAVVGALPFVARKNAFTVGFAIPGIVALGGSLVDQALGALNLTFLPKPALRGAALGAPAQQMASARQALDAIRQRYALQQRGAAPQRAFARAV